MDVINYPYQWSFSEEYEYIDYTNPQVAHNIIRTNQSDVQPSVYSFITVTSRKSFTVAYHWWNDFLFKSWLLQQGHYWTFVRGIHL